MLRFLLKSLLITGTLGTIIIAAMVLYIVPKLPAIDSLLDVKMQIPLRIYSHNKQSLIAEYGEKRRVPVTIDQVPQQLINAFIASEDERFYIHPGVDWQGLARAAISLLLTGERKQGGSTITMQVARNFFLSREKTYLRKLNEIFLAIKIETQLKKDDILELYINKIYLGQRAYGVGAAAQVYYGADIAELTLAQYAMIAGLPKAPSASNPVSNPEAARDRRGYVLRRMLNSGFISQAEYEHASQAPLTASLHRPDIDLDAAYIAEMVRKHLTAEYADEAYTAGYIVTTTVIDKNQHAANHALQKALLAYDSRHGYRGAEQHYELAADSHAAQWEVLLEPYSSIGPLYPALITHVNENSVSAYLTGIGSIDIEWSGLKWARRYINENLRKPAPKTAADILLVGDVVRIREDENGDWRLAQIPEVEGGLISVDPNTGAALALVGGFDFYRSKFNRVIQANRQPGSSFKPFIYSAAMANGFSAASMINDAPVVFDDRSIGQKWRPKNYSSKNFGPTTLREALRKSRNLVSIRLLNRIGIPTALEHIAKFNLNTDTLPQNLSLALGSGEVSPWQLAGAYAVMANGGYKTTPYFIEKIETYEGDVIFTAQPKTVCHDCAHTTITAITALEETAKKAELATEAAITTTAESRYAERAVDPQNVWIMHSLLKDVVKHGTGRKAYHALKREDLAGKTGTTNDQHDAWFAGFNTKVVAIAWVGFDKFQPLGKIEVGGKAALPMWIDYMRVALNDIPHSVMERPAGLVDIRIDPKRGCQSHANNDRAVFEVLQAGQLANLPDCKNISTPFLQQDDSNPGTLF